MPNTFALGTGHAHASVVFEREMKSTVLLISSHFEHYGSVSVARAQYICIGHGPRSRFRGVRSEMKSTVFEINSIPVGVAG